MATQIGQIGLPCSNATEGGAACGFDPADGVRDNKILKGCTVCESEAEMRCPGCGTWYCGRECLKKDWYHHKILCQILKDGFHGHSAPINNVRAILFPMNGNKPTWVWINLRSLHVDIARALGIPKEKRAIKKPVNKLAVKDINKSLQHRKIGHGIRQFTAPNMRLEGPDGCNINKSIFALADPGSLKIYFGSAIFFGFRTYQAHGTTKIYYEDASLRDLRIIIEWYYTRPENPFISKSHRLPIKSYVNPGDEASLWPAIKVNCQADVDRLSKLTGQVCSPTQQVEVLSKDVFKTRTKSDHAAMAELPWVVQPCGSTFDPVTDTGKEIDLLGNKVGSIYVPQTKSRFQPWHLDNSEGWALPSHLPSNSCGSILVLHKDGCDIFSLHVLIFYRFVVECLDKIKNVKPLVVLKTEEQGIGRALVDEHEVQRAITREKFEIFWLETFQSLGAGMPAYVSPYADVRATVLEQVVEKHAGSPLQMAEKLLLVLAFSMFIPGT
ncbi:hypothetical protein F4859DRAFT_527354 [Xylaria cf. heliscus]|nr:hypothetical protein F4859DRAFT_527354 [Xylaria cf. heliscus]